MEVMTTNIRQPQVHDANYLLDIDIKCFDDPWPVEKWKVILVNNDISKLVSTSYGCPTGFIIWKRDSISLPIIRFAVKPTYRNQGTGLQLLKAVCLGARQLAIPRIVIPVPESLCCPGEPRDVSHWLLKRGFKLNGNHSILKEGAICFGQVEDAFLFTLEPGSLK